MKLKVKGHIFLLGLVPVIFANSTWAGPNQKPDSQTQNKREWKSAPVLSSKLGSEIRIDAYACRLPQGYSPFPTPIALMSKKPFSDGEIKAFQYKSHAYSDGVASIISYHIFSPGYIAYINNFPASPTDTKSLTESWLYAQKAIVLQAHPSAIFSREEYGQLGGLYFVRRYIRYSTMRGTKKVTVHRFTYVSISDSGGIEASFFDNEPHCKVSFPIAEASILTLHKFSANADKK